MSQKAQAEDGVAFEAGVLPPTGNTLVLTTTGSSASDQQAIAAAGLYRIKSNVTVTLAQGVSATVNDLELSADAPEYFYLPVGTVTLVDAGAGGGTVKFTLMA